MKKKSTNQPQTEVDDPDLAGKLRQDYQVQVELLQNLMYRKLLANLPVPCREMLELHGQLDGLYDALSAGRPVRVGECTALLTLAEHVIIGEGNLAAVGV